MSFEDANVRHLFSDLTNSIVVMQDYLTVMSQGNPQNLNEFRIQTTSLEKVMLKIWSKKQSRKLGR